MTKNISRMKWSCSVIVPEELGHEGQGRHGMITEAGDREITFYLYIGSRDGPQGVW